MPIRSPRRIYELTGLTRPADDQPDTIDPPTDEDPDGTEVTLFGKLKEAVGNYLGLTPLPWDDVRLEGTFSNGTDGTNLNRGATYARNIGGFKVTSWKLVPETTFTLTEKFILPGDTQYSFVESNFKSMYLGLPTGARVWQVRRWLGTLQNFDNIQYMVTPNGRKVDLYSASPTP